MHRFCNPDANAHRRFESCAQHRTTIQVGVYPWVVNGLRVGGYDRAGMVEMVCAAHLKCAPERDTGSNPVTGTRVKRELKKLIP